MLKFLPGFEIHPDTVIWRYLDMEKFHSLIETRALYFASARQFADKFEGAVTEADYHLRFKAHERIMHEADLLTFAMRSGSHAFQELTRLTKISCWHINEHESVAMWQLYLREGRGVAVRSSVKRLSDAIGEFRLKPDYGAEDIILGAVRYINYFTEQLPDQSMLGRYFCKRASYAYEKEFRAVISLRLAEEFGCDVPENGILVPVNLKTLIDKVYVAPGLNTDFRCNIEAIAAQIGIESLINQSNLDKDPLY